MSQTDVFNPKPEIAPVFSALGDETRLAIVSRLLGASDQSISNLTQGFPLTRQGLSRHLKVLEDAGLVRSHRVGRETRYQIEADALCRARDYLDRASRQWDNAIDRLARHLES